jgi:hypothetical protein
VRAFLEKPAGKEWEANRKHVRDAIAGASIPLQKRKRMKEREKEREIGIIRDAIA